MPFLSLAIIAYSIQQLFLITPLCPFATCDLGGVTPAPPIRLKWPDPIDGTLICRVAMHSDYTPQWHSHRHHSVWWRWGSTHYYARGGTTTRGDHPRTSPIGLPLLLLPESLDDYDTIITSSYNICDYVIWALYYLLLGVPFPGSPPGHHQRDSY